MELEIGKVYEISHQRKGTFIGNIKNLSEEWVTFELIEGDVEYLSANVSLDIGEEETVRMSFCTFKEI
jgi:hypothetical protein